MANKPQIQYIHQFYTPGSEAQKVAPAYSPRRSRTTLPKVAPREKIRVQVDIYFTAIGLFTIPDEKELQKLMDDIRENPQKYRLSA